MNNVDIFGQQILRLDFQYLLLLEQQLEECDGNSEPNAVRALKVRIRLVKKKLSNKFF